MNTQEFKMTMQRRVLLSIAVFAASLFAAAVLYVVFRIFMPRPNILLNITVIVGLAAIVIARVLYNYFVIYRQSIEVNNDKMILKNGDKIIGEYQFSHFGFGSKIHTHYYYGIKVSVKRILVVSNGSQEKKIACNFLNKDDFNQLMSLLDNYSLRHDNAAAAGVDHPIADSAAAEPAIQKQSISVSYRLKTENMKVNLGKILLLSVFVSLLIELLVAVPLVNEIADGAKLTKSDINTMVMYTLFAIGAGVLIFIISFATRKTRVANARRTTPETISVNNTAITFGQQTYATADITAVTAIPVSYNRGDAALRPLTITTKDGKRMTYSLGALRDPKKPEQAVFTADEYADLLYNLRQVFIDRPGVFSHQLEAGYF